jgi:hypothetical protein
MLHNGGVTPANLLKSMTFSMVSLAIFALRALLAMESALYYTILYYYWALLMLPWPFSGLYIEQWCS